MHDTLLSNTKSHETHEGAGETRGKDFARAHKNGKMRFVIVCIGIPISAFVYLYPLKGFLLPRILYLCLLTIMICEMRNLLPLAMRPYRVIAIVAGLLFPMLALIASFFPVFALYQYKVGVFVLSGILLFCALSVLRRTQNNFVDTIVEKISGILFLAVYPGLFGSYYMLLPNLTDSVVHMVLVTGIVFANDGFAYLLGRFFGKKGESPLIHISSSKTLTGFLGGLIGGGIMVAIFYIVREVYFPGGIFKITIFGLCINAAGMLGDLFESALKRSARCKDSGSIMLGRGGVLDTLDSLLFASATYYILYPIFY